MQEIATFPVNIRKLFMATTDVILNRDSNYKKAFSPHRFLDTFCGFNDSNGDEYSQPWQHPLKEVCGCLLT
jgi:hypothetical protein